MRLLITGICGFVGSTLARAFAAAGSGHTLVGFDNFIRPGSESNRAELKRLGVKLHHGDLRAASDLETLPAVDWVIDAAANPSVLAGVDGKTSSRQLVEHNLAGTVNMLEFCKQHRAGFILLSTSRVYSIEPLAALPVVARDGAFQPHLPLSPSLALSVSPSALSPAGLTETFPTPQRLTKTGRLKVAPYSRARASLASLVAP